eukprot:422996-Prorocentrum_minimum.AAC.2
MQIRDVQVHEVADEQEAFEVLDAASAPGLVLLDAGLPNRRAFKMCSALRAKTSGRPVPVIFLGHNPERSDVVKAMKAGANDYIDCTNLALELLVARVKNNLQARVEKKKKNKRPILPLLGPSSDPLLGPSSGGAGVLPDVAAEAGVVAAAERGDAHRAGPHRDGGAVQRGADLAGRIESSQERRDC